MGLDRKLLLGLAVVCMAASLHVQAQTAPLAFSGTFNHTSDVGPNLGTLQTVDQSTIQGLGLGMMSALQAS